MIQGLDIAQSVSETEPRDTNLAGGKAIKHESIVGIRTMSDADLAHLGGRIAAGTFRF